MKILVTIMLCLFMMINTSSSYALSNVSNSMQMDNFDIIVAAYTYTGGLEKLTQTRSGIITVEKIVPLYNYSIEVVAYYVTFSSDEYAVINNNIENPVAIEFGSGVQEKIEEQLRLYHNPIIIYNNPISVYEKNDIEVLSNNNRDRLSDIYDYYPDLEQKNDALSVQHKIFKNTVISSGAIMQSKGDGDYGFINITNMPTASYDQDMIENAFTLDWAIMDDYNDIASNHCPATTVTNLALYFAANGYPNLKINNKNDTFEAVHDIMGNGPDLIIAGYASSYFEDRGYNLNYESFDHITDIKDATTNDRPCGILLYDDIFAMHWVIGVGWREYTASGDLYFRINDNWNGNVNKFYKPGHGSTFWSGTAYWVEE